MAMASAGNEFGRFLDEADNLSHARVVVLGSEARDKLFSGIPAIGDSVRINGASFQVVGVLKPRMQEADSNENRVVYAPYNSMDTLRDNHYLSGMWLDSIGLDHNKMSQSIRDALASQHGFKSSDERAVFVFDAQKQLEQFSITSIGTFVISAQCGELAAGLVAFAGQLLVLIGERSLLIL